jgi:hypothetical protein
MFLVESDDQPESDVIWSDAVGIARPVRQPTLAEKRSILLVGLAAIGWIVLMAVILIVAVYISRHR